MDQKLIYVSPEASYQDYPEYIIVGEAPGAEEEKEDKPFCGKSGTFLREALVRFLDLNNRQYYITNVVKVRPTKNRTPTAKEIYSWCELLSDEIERIDPLEKSKIIAVGKVAEKALDFLRLKNHFIYHPAHVMIHNSKYFEWVAQIRSVNGDQ